MDVDFISKKLFELEKQDDANARLVAAQGKGKAHEPDSPSLVTAYVESRRVILEKMTKVRPVDSPAELSV